MHGYYGVFFFIIFCEKHKTRKQNIQKSNCLKLMNPSINISSILLVWYMGVLNCIYIYIKKCYHMITQTFTTKKKRRKKKKKEPKRKKEATIVLKSPQSIPLCRSFRGVFDPFVDLSGRSSTPLSIFLGRNVVIRASNGYKSGWRPP